MAGPKPRLTRQSTWDRGPIVGWAAPVLRLRDDANNVNAISKITHKTSRMNSSMKTLVRQFATLSCLLGVVPLHAIAAAAPPVVAPPSLLVPQHISVPCQGPRGAVVSFAVAAPDPTQTAPNVECQPPSGSLFP